MFRKLIAFLLITALIGGTFSRYVIAVGFQLNKRYIINVLCENKLKPKMHCNGKCYLAKKMSEADESEKKGQAKLTQTMPEFVSLQPGDKLQLSERTYQVVFTPKRPFVASNYSLSVNSYCFRPPRLS